ncbi:MAG: phosphoenolpyruvate--protein phosphotransferase [Bacteroidota bacterium]
MELVAPAPAVPEASVQGRDIPLISPLAGWVVPLADVPDPIFSERVLGDGIAIDPAEGLLCAPCDGMVAVLHRAHHALTLRTADGAEILIHIGLDTVALNGAGFDPRVAEGQAVKAGDPLIAFDLDALAGKVRSLLIPVLLLNGDSYRLALPQVDRAVARGDGLMRAVAVSAAAAVSAASTEGPDVRREARMQDPHGIHARPAGLLAECARGFDAVVTLQANGRSASARSAVSLMLLGVQQGDAVTICARGPQAEAAVAAIALLIDNAAGARPGEAAPPAAPPPPVMVAQTLPDFAPGEVVELAAVQAAPGMAVGRAVRLLRQSLDIPEAGTGAAAETARLDAALAQVRAGLQTAIGGAQPGPQAKILAAHMAFLDDPDLRDGTLALIAEGKSAAFAWTATIDQRVDALRRLGNAVLAERAADLQDVQRKVTLVLLGKTDAARELPDNAIIIADDLLPSQLTELQADRLAGLCLAGGGPTSHVAILSASLGLPALVAAGAEVLRIPDGTPLILDADHGRLSVNPPAGESERIATLVRRRAQVTRQNREQAQQDCRMADGTRIAVMANLGSPADVPAALAGGAEGCGLLRSEFLFLNRDSAPTEDEQFAQYQAIASGLQGRPLIIRTLDAGGDKDLPYAELPKDENPALGLRGVRMSLWRPELMRAQLRAILRVQPAGQVSIMLPMIATLADLRVVRAMLDEEKAALGITTAVKLGIMVEVPSAAVMADLFAAEADFFSVGTNDLTQYALAMDRTNPHLAKQLDSFHPAVLRLIASAAEGAARHGRWVGVCGGLASFPIAAPVLIGLGVTELSCTASAVPDVKAMVRGLTMDVCKDIAAQALQQDSAPAVRALLARQWPEA